MLLSCTVLQTNEHSSVMRCGVTHADVINYAILLDCSSQRCGNRQRTQWDMQVLCIASWPIKCYQFYFYDNFSKYGSILIILLPLVLAFTDELRKKWNEL